MILLIIGSVKQKSYDSDLEKEYQPSGTFSDIGTNQIHFEYDGEGETTFVLISGLGESLVTWNAIYDNLKSMGRVFRYDRSGLGFSEEGSLPRSVDAQVEELMTVLTNENIEGPYILIGHSAGAFMGRHFANRYPEQVSGLFLLDPYQEMARDHFGEWSMRFKLMNWTFRNMAWSGLPYALLPEPPHPMYKSTKAIRTYGNEAYTEDLSIDQFKKLNNNSKLPVYLITANNSSPENNKLFEKWNAEILAKYDHPVNKHIIVDSGHHVHIEKPEIVLQALDEFISKLSLN